MACPFPCLSRHREEYGAPHVVQDLEIINTPGSAHTEREHEAGGQLQWHIPEAVGLQENEVIRVFRQVASAVGYCQVQGIMHWDLKADTVLLELKEASSTVTLAWPEGPWLDRC